MYSIQIGIYCEKDEKLNKTFQNTVFFSIEEMTSYLELMSAQYKEDPMLVVRVADGERPFLLNYDAKYSLNEFIKEVFKYYSINRDIQKNENRITENNNPKKNNAMKERTKDEMKEFYQNYKIDSEKGLSHTDVYAFLNKTTNGMDKINQILSEKGIEIASDDRTKTKVLENIVYPVKQAGIEKEFKDDLNLFLNNVKEFSKEQTQIKENTPKYTIGEIKDFYEKYKFEKNANLSHTDVYAFCFKYGNQEATKKINELVSQLLGRNVELKPFFKKNELLKEVIYPLKEAGKTNEFKEKFIELLQQEKSKEQNKEQSFILSMEKLDKILSSEEAKELLYDAGVKETVINMLGIKSNMNLQAEDFIEKKKTALKNISNEAADNLSKIAEKMEKSKGQKM